MALKAVKDVKDGMLSRIGGIYIELSGIFWFFDTLMCIDTGRK